MTESKYKYSVAVSESTQAEDLEILLNQKALEGYELFMIHEVDSRSGKTQYNCIFSKYDAGYLSSEGETIEITDITDFKKHIEKIYQSKDPYKDYIKAQNNIININKQIAETKKTLETSENDAERILLNEKLHDQLESLHIFQHELSTISDTFKLYDRIKSNKITIYLSEELIKLTDTAEEDNLIARNILLRQDLTDRIGYVIPNIRYSDTVELEPLQYRIDIRDIPAAIGFVYPDYRMFYKGQINLPRKPKSAITSIDPIWSNEVLWLKNDTVKDFWEKGLSASDVIANHLEFICIKHCQDLIDYKDVYKYFEVIKKENEDLVESIIPDLISLGEIKQILGTLIKEMVSIKDVTFIFEKIIDFQMVLPDKNLLLEKVRTALKRQISFSRSDNLNNIYVIMLDLGLSKFLKENLQTPENSPEFLDLTKEEMSSFIREIHKILQKNQLKINNISLITTPELRFPLYTLLESYIPSVSVLSYEEISVEYNLQAVATLTKKALSKNKLTDFQDSTIEQE